MVLTQGLAGSIGATIKAEAGVGADGDGATDGGGGTGGGGGGGGGDEQSAGGAPSEPRAAGSAPHEGIYRDAACWGFVKSARLELPRVTLQAVDLDEFRSEVTVQSLCALLTAPTTSTPPTSEPPSAPPSASHASPLTSGGACVALAAGHLFHEHLLPSDSVLPPPPSPPGAEGLLSPTSSPSVGRRRGQPNVGGTSAGAGTALITGGTGALALQLARWLVEQRRASHVVLSSRSGTPSPQNAPLLEALRLAVASGGATLTIAQVDASSRQAMRDLLASHADGLAAGGVYHAAGVLDDGLLRGQSGARLERVLAPKAHAALLLHDLLTELDVQPRDFVLFSSVTSLAGTLGQTNYGSANGILDALAARRRAQGLPAMSVQWGPWGGHGMATGERAAVGLWLPLEPPAALEAFGEALQLQEAGAGAPVRQLVQTRSSPQLVQSRSSPQLVQTRPSLLLVQISSWPRLVLTIAGSNRTLAPAGSNPSFASAAAAGCCFAPATVDGNPAFC